MPFFGHVLNTTNTFQYLHAFDSYTVICNVETSLLIVFLWREKINKHMIVLGLSMRQKQE